MDNSVPGLAGAISQQLERVVFVAGDYIIRSGEESEGMYFVSSGLVEVVGSEGEVIKHLGASAFFGEMALLNPEGRAVASVRVKTFCEGYRLSVESYDKIVGSYPSFRECVLASLMLKRFAIHPSIACILLFLYAIHTPVEEIMMPCTLNVCSYLTSAAKLRLRHAERHLEGQSLEHMFDMLNPTKRRLIRKSTNARLTTCNSASPKCARASSSHNTLQAGVASRLSTSKPQDAQPVQV